MRKLIRWARISTGEQGLHGRARNFLSDGEMDGFLGASKKYRHGVRDFLPLLMMCRHGLGVSEAVRVWRQDLNLDGARVWIRRLENGQSIEPSFTSDELGALKRYLHTLPGALSWLFVSENVQSMNRRQH